MEGTDGWKQHRANSLDTLPPDTSDTSGQPEYQVQKKNNGTTIKQHKQDAAGDFRISEKQIVLVLVILFHT